MDQKTKTIMETLRGLSGLANVFLLTEEEKDIIRALELKENLGVHECLKRPYSIIFTHDASFRGPMGQIVKAEGKNVTFPPVPFPEVSGAEVVSSSPSEKVHQWLVERFRLRLKDEATLLVGFA